MLLGVGLGRTLGDLRHSRGSSRIYFKSETFSVRSVVLSSISFFLKGFTHFVEHLPGIERATIDAGKGAFGGARQSVDQAGVNALARTAFADEQHGNVRAGDFRGKDVK